MALCETKTPPFILPCTVCMTILYCATKLKSANSSLHTISRQTAKFNDRQYFQIYWYGLVGGRGLGGVWVPIKSSTCHKTHNKEIQVFMVCVWGGGGGHSAERAWEEENTDNASSTSLFLSWVVQLLWYWM